MTYYNIEGLQVLTCFYKFKVKLVRIGYRKGSLLPNLYGRRIVRYDLNGIL